MPISVLDLFTIGIGPSSSHSVGPMRAAKAFVRSLADSGMLERTARVNVRLFGSLALTGKGHGTDKAVLLGLMGQTPDGVDVEAIPACMQKIRDSHRLTLAGDVSVEFDEETDLVFDRKTTMPGHPNAMRFTALNAEGEELAAVEYYSVGGGFILTAEELEAGQKQSESQPDQRPYPFESGAELYDQCRHSDSSVSEIMLANEHALGNGKRLRGELLKRWKVMQECVERGRRTQGVLPGGLKVRRRAAALSQKLEARDDISSRDPLAALDWVNLFALAVNEENAAGGRVVTAPTNGAAGIIPAVLHYFMRFCEGASEDAVVRFFLTAGAIAVLYKKNASISGAEVGCQGEVGVACSMAAGALTEALRGSPAQVLQAAEIAMEHHLGLTCDPIGGLVQVPCIERNAVASVTAINASRLALAGDGTHRVSLDKVIATMRQTGEDMSAKYKETARGGLAIQVNVVEC